ncbi:hypothetical protein [Chlamydia pecorum]|uniref:hypothetical protein n=1 Tax=Chlamydia pecorum TaxID=85991 RepID=UPI0003F6ED2C|nr:hypothetical protein [Chlamydia pecorum]
MASGVGGPTGPRGPGKFPQEQPNNEGRVGEHTVSGNGPSSVSNPGSGASSASELAARVSSGAQGVIGNVSQQASESAHVGATHQLKGVFQHFAENVRKIFDGGTSLPQGTPPPEVDPLSLEDLSSRLSGLKELDKSVLSEEDRKNLEDLIRTTEDQIAGLGGAGGTQVLRGTAIRLSNEDIASLTDQEVANIITQGEAAKESLKDLGGKLSPMLKDANESISRMSRAATPASSSGRTSAKLSRSASLTAQKILRGIRNVFSFLLRVVLRVLVNIRCALGNARRAAAEAFKRCCCCSGGDDDSSSDIDPKASVRVLRSQSSRRHRDLEDSLEKWSGTDRISPKSAASWQGEDPEISVHPADVPQEGQDTGGDDDRIYLQIVPGNNDIRSISSSGSNIDRQDRRSGFSSSGWSDVVYQSAEEVFSRDTPTPPPVSPRPPHTLGPTGPKAAEPNALYAKPHRSPSPSKPADVQTPSSPPLPPRSADLDSESLSESIYEEIDLSPQLPPRPGIFFPNKETIYAELARDIYLPVFPDQEEGHEGDVSDIDSPPISPRNPSEYERPLPKTPSGNEKDYDNLRSPPTPPRGGTPPIENVPVESRFLKGLSIPVPGASAEYDWIRPEDVVSTMKASAAPTLPPRSGNEPGRGAEAIAIETSPGFGIEVAASMLADAVEKTLGKLDAVETSEGNVSSSDIENLRNLSSLIKDMIRSSQGKSGSGESS